MKQEIKHRVALLFCSWWSVLPTRLIVPLVGTDKKASQKITAYNNRYCSSLQKLDQKWCKRCGASLQMRSVADGQREIQKMLILHNVGQRTHFGKYCFIKIHSPPQNASVMELSNIFFMNWTCLFSLASSGPETSKGNVRRGDIHL